MDLDKKLALTALSRLDQKLMEADFQEITLAVGGGGSMILAYGYPGGTQDIAAAPLNAEFESLKPFMSEVALELQLAPDWLNPHYGAFTLYLPEDSKSRMTEIFSGKKLTVKSLAAEDLLIMKLMAGRAKDIGHIHHLLAKKINLKIVEKRLEQLKQLFPKLAHDALDLFDEMSGDKN